MHISTRLLLTASLSALATACLRPPPAARVARSAPNVGTCDSAASIDAARQTLVGAARTLGALSVGAEMNAYEAVRQVETAPALQHPSPHARVVSGTMVANSARARTELWSHEASLYRDQIDNLNRQIGALDAAAGALPTPAACRAAGLQ